MNTEHNPAISLPVVSIKVDHTFNARVGDIDDEGNTHYPEVDKLANQIKKDGLLSPICVRPLGAESEGIVQYELVYGFRRLEAVKSLGHEFVYAQVWDGGNKDALFINLAENVARKNLTSYEKAKRYAEMKEQLNVSGREIARRLGENGSHVNNLIRVYQEADPRILEEWRKGHGMATTDNLSKRIVQKGLSHEDQWDLWLEACGLKTNDGLEEGDDAPEPKLKPKRPGAKHLEAALSALDDCDKPDAWIAGAKSALRWALAKTKTLPGVYNPARPPKAEPEYDEDTEI